MKDDEHEHTHPKPEEAAECQVDEDARFNNSLLELKDLRSQLHYAANYCESSFFNSKQKKMVMENTKEYICRALVTVVDHVGSVSMNLESMVLKNEEFTDTALRLSCLQQRLVTCRDYAETLATPKLGWTQTFQKHHAHYTSLLPQEKSTHVVSRNQIDASQVPKTTPKYNTNAEKARPLLIFKYGRQASLTKLPLADINHLTKHIMDSSSEFPICHPFVMSIPRNPSFQFQETNKVGRNDQNKKFLQLPWTKPYKKH